MADVTFDNVTKVFDESSIAVDRLDLEIRDREFMVIVGPSGCGKTTALRMLAGLESVSEGEIRIDGQPVTDVPPERRDIAMVFQSYALYPHMTVAQNLGFGLRMRHEKKALVAERVQEAARILGIEELLARKPRQLSGGQRQRVALGRAIVRHPRVFLLDEPLSNLDAELRAQIVGDDPDDKRLIYFIGWDGGPIKIGLADDIRVRLRTLQVACPYKLKVLAAVAGGLKREKSFHAQFAHRRLRGEWFERCAVRSVSSTVGSSRCTIATSTAASRGARVVMARSRSTNSSNEPSPVVGAYASCISRSTSADAPRPLNTS